MDKAALGRLRQAIAVEDGDEEEQEQQLNGVLRMLGAEIPERNQLPLFGKPPALARSPSREARLARRPKGA
jgi:hypothetical protein